MSDFSLSIRIWYRQNGRNLPWRETNDPYKIWLSEIILQQTRVEQGRSYYLKFIKNYPTVSALAKAQEQDILNDWQGLGYYSRARNLHSAAKFIENELNGKFPNTYKELLKLKGVGKYTAAAIASFGFNEPKAVVDGNVYRLLSRYFLIDTPIDSASGQKEFQEVADMLIPMDAPAEHNQSIMEIGAVICAPQPKCEECPLSSGCLARAQNKHAELPVKSKKTKVRKRYFHYLLFEDKGKTVIKKRTHKDIWQHLYEFPLIETEVETDLSANISNVRAISSEIVHILSHQKIHARFYHLSEIPKELKEDWQTINISDIQDYPLPRIIDRYLEKYHLE